MKTIICTAGTSIANSCPQQKHWQANASSWESDGQALSAEIRSRVAGLDLSSKAGRTQASAEINSLNRLGLDHHDQVVLLATDTVDGRICAEEVRSIICSELRLPESGVRIERVPGLQVRDSEKLRREGLPNLVEIALRYIDDPQYRHGGEIILNPTGGFKGVVPFMSVLGMLFRLRTVYVFEFAEALVNLPPLPVTFDLHLFERAEPALEAMEREIAIPLERYFKMITGFQAYERDLFNGFIAEIEPGKVTMSPLAMALFAVDQEGVHDVRLSPAAAAVLEQSEGVKRAALERMLMRVASPLWRTLHAHINQAGLIYYKPGATAERVSAVVCEGAVMVCGLFTDHDDYERAIAAKRAPGEFAQYKAWAPPDTLDHLEQRYQSEIEKENRFLQAEMVKVRNEAGERIGDKTSGYREEISRLKGLLDNERRKSKELREDASKYRQQLDKIARAKLLTPDDESVSGE